MDRATMGMLAIVCLVGLSAGCGGVAQVGLANAPVLGGTPTTDNRVRDVISNGLDGCDHDGLSPLVAHTPPCPNAVEKNTLLVPLDWGRHGGYTMYDPMPAPVWPCTWGSRRLLPAGASLVTLAAVPAPNDDAPCVACAAAATACITP